MVAQVSGRRCRAGNPGPLPNKRLEKVAVINLNERLSPAPRWLLTDSWLPMVFAVSATLIGAAIISLGLYVPDEAPLRDRLVIESPISQHLAQSVRWDSERARQGDAAAQRRLGRIYYVGLGVPPDVDEAAKWFALAAEQGDSEAQFAIGYLAFAGEGTTKDNARAYKWLSLAATSHNRYARPARRLRDKLKAHMNREDVAAAEAAVRAWRPATLQAVPGETH